MELQVLAFHATQRDLAEDTSAASDAQAAQAEQRELARRAGLPDITGAVGVAGPHVDPGPPVPRPDPDTLPPPPGAALAPRWPVVDGHRPEADALSRSTR